MKDGELTAKSAATNENVGYGFVKEAGAVIYVDIANNLKRLAADRLKSKSIAIDVIPWLSNSGQVLGGEL